MDSRPAFLEVSANPPPPPATGRWGDIWRCAQDSGGAWLPGDAAAALHCLPWRFKETTYATDLGAPLSVAWSLGSAANGAAKASLEPR